MSDFSTNVGLNSSANKQYAIAKQMQAKQQQVDEKSTGKERGKVSNEQLTDMTNPQTDKYVTALAMQDEVTKTKKKYQPTVDSLKERLEKALESKYDNAHNMIAEAFYGFQAGSTSSLLGLLGADPAEVDAIRKKAYEQAKEKVTAGFRRLAHAYAEYEIYAS